MKNINRILTGSIFSALVLTGSAGFAQAPVKEETTTTTTVVTSAGTITEFGDDTFQIRSETSPEPLRYTYSKTTTYLDEDGQPVSIKTVKSGLPVTVYYTKVGDKMVVSKVIVRKAVKVVPPVVEEKQTTTTTTTTKKKKD